MRLIRAVAVALLLAGSASSAHLSESGLICTLTGKENRHLLLPIERWQAVLPTGEDVHRHLLLQGLGLVQSLRAVPIYRLASFTPAEKPSLIQSRTRRHLRLR